MLLSTSDFTVRPYRISNIEESKDFIDFAKRAEREILTQILGYPLWALVDGVTATAAKTALINGGEYTYNDKTYKYYGLVDLLKPAVLSKWVPTNNYILTNVGYIEKSPSETSTIIDSEPFIVQLWNEYVVKVGGCKSQKGTLYGFMKANEGNYPDWCFAMPTLKNRYGI